MKVFWVLLLLVLVGGAVALGIKLRGQSSSGSGAARSAQSLPADPAPVAPVPTDGQSPTPAPALATGTAPSASIAGAGAAIPAAQGDAQDVTGGAMARLDEKFAAAVEASQQPGGAPPPAVTVGPAQVGEYAVAPDRIRRRGDGALVIDERFVLHGDGSAEKPFEVPWELLVSVEEFFDPSKKLEKLPERVALLHGKHVQLRGFVAFPLMVPKPQELLSMLNQWDGCCIGVPPTPYDAVEVKLTSAVAGDDRFAISGTVRGVFKVEPYITRGKDISWLVGLFVMENATFQTTDAMTPGS